MSRKFPPRFIWGVATSSYQIEGGVADDGKGPSIWDRFSKIPGKVEDGSNGDVACDHYHRYRQDVALMKELGVSAYRFSVSWPRVLPEGRGQANRPGLDFYSRLVDALLEAGILPFLTLYHWDLPVTLQDAGGWVERGTAEAFAEYADLLSRELGDRVKHWITHNEPWCSAILGHQRGIHAPGLEDFGTALAVSHHLLLSHGLAVGVLRDNCARGTEIGIALNLTPVTPASPSAADQEACRHIDGFFNRWFLDPLYGKGYPADMIEDYAELGYLPESGLPNARADDLTAIAAPIDFLGVNYYNRTVARSERIPEHDNELPSVFRAPETEWTDMGWEVYPDGLCVLLEDIVRRYAPSKVYVTENGASYGEGPDGAGRVPDERRIRFLREHLLAAHRAFEAGVPLSGYFVWSLLDNFEWERGYTQRFGIVWVDYTTLERRPKDSALWYRGVIEQNGI